MAKKNKSKRSLVEAVTAWLEGALAVSQAFERLLVDVFVAYVPLFAPIIPATIAFLSLYVVLQMPLLVSVSLITTRRRMSTIRLLQRSGQWAQRSSILWWY